MERHDRGDRGPNRSFAPVKVGDEMDVKIEAVGEKGDGIAKKNGFVLFVPNTHEGDEVHIRVTKVLRKVGFAEVAGSKAPTKEELPEKSSEKEPKKDDFELDENIEDTENFGEEENN